MDKTLLVERNIKQGRRLLEVLDEARFQVTAAMWFYFPEDEEWRLVIASPFISGRGPRESYAIIQRTLKQGSFGISLKQISVVSPNDDLIRLIKVAIRTGPGVSDIRFTKNTINNVFIEDAYIYRMQ